MALVTCAGADVLRGEIHLSTRGRWWAELVLDTATAPSGACTIAAEGGLSLVGAIVTAGVDLADRAQVRVVGGAGGLEREVTGAFQVAQLRDPLNTIMRATGEKISSTVAADVLAVSLRRWTLGRHAAGRALDELANAASTALGRAVTWRVLPDGTVWIGAESWPTENLPPGADILDRIPAEQRVVIGCETPALLPGVALADVGQVLAVDHWITPGEVRTWAHTAPGFAESFRQTVRAALGLPLDAGAAPRIDRMAMYRAEVKVARADGATVDVQPEDPRVSGMQAIPLRVGIPAAVAVVQPGAIVLVGWERGDPSRPYAVPSWEQGAAVTKLVLNADQIYLGGEAGSEKGTKGETLKSYLDALKPWLEAHIHSGGTISGSTGTPTIASPTVPDVRTDNTRVK